MSAIDVSATPHVAPVPVHGATRRLMRRPIAAVSVAVIVVFALAGIAAPLLVGDPRAQDYAAILQGPTSNHLLGTDDLGRDLLARVVYGARVSVVVGLLTTSLGFAVALPLGLLAGYRRGWVDVVVARGVDVMLAFPYIVVAVGLTAIAGPSLMTAAVALASAQVPWLLRIVRGEVLSLRERDYVAAAVLDGARDRTILLRYLVPNLSGVLIVQATLMFPFAIIGEALLSFLGLGVRPPTPTWGTMLANAQAFVHQNAWPAIVPGVAIASVTFAFNLLGDNLRDVLDPRSAR